MASRSASSRMIAADLPPSSSVQRLSCSPQMAPILRPATPEPVNEILSVSGWRTRYSLTSRSACTMLSTPAGSPASCTISARRYASSGVSGDGFSTTVEPDARAGPSFSDVTNSGTFHGTIAPTTPTGSRRTSVGPRMPGRRSSNGVLTGEARVVVEHHGGGEDLPHGRPGDGRAHLLGDGAGHLLVAGLDAGGDGGDHVGALGRAHLRPGAVVERLAGGGDGAVDVGGGGLGDLGDDLFGVRRDHGELVGSPPGRPSHRR